MRGDAHADGWDGAGVRGDVHADGWDGAGVRGDVRADGTDGLGRFGSAGMDTGRSSCVLSRGKSVDVRAGVSTLAG